jgi:hypothetical protein
MSALRRWSPAIVILFLNGLAAPTSMSGQDLLPSASIRVRASESAEPGRRWIEGTVARLTPDTLWYGASGSVSSMLLDNAEIQRHRNRRLAGMVIGGIAGGAIGALGGTFGQSSPTSRGDATCWEPGPLPECRLSVLTEFGGYLNIGDLRLGHRLDHSGAAMDWGVMFNRDAHNAYGATLSLWLQTRDSYVGPSLRYRRWFEDGSSLDLGLGTVVWGFNWVKAGSIVGLVRYNPRPWLALGLRPQYLRWDCDRGARYHDACPSDDPNRPPPGPARIYIGVELGGGPGRWMPLIGGAVWGLLWLTGGPD